MLKQFCPVKVMARLRHHYIQTKKLQYGCNTGEETGEKLTEIRNCLRQYNDVQFTASSVPGPHGLHCVAEGPGENQYRNFKNLVVCWK
jgi:hypothetical protein